MKSEFIIALTQLAAERNLPRESVLSAIEAALVSAYRRDSVAAGQDISVKLHPGSGEIEVYIVKTVVEDVGEPLQQISLPDAKKIKPDAQIDDVIPVESLPHSAGRIAAQTAKQVVMQRLREAERELVYQEFAEREGEVFTVSIQRMESRHIVVDLGRAEAVLPPSEQVPYDRYRIGQKFKVVLQSIRQSIKGPEIIVSRSDKLLLKRLFEMEVPEIYSGSVEILGIAREAGSRSKVAVWAKQDGVDAVGSCVGLRGIRIQNIVNELHGEKIDVVQWDSDPAKFIASALSPSTVMRVDIDHDNGSAAAVVPERQLSLAIGKEGQNARLAARLTGLKVDIRSDLEDETAAAKKSTKETAAAKKSTKKELIEETTIGHDSPLERLGISSRVLSSLKRVGIDKIDQILGMNETQLLDISGFGEKSLKVLHTRLRELGFQIQEPSPDAQKPYDASPKSDAKELTEVSGGVVATTETAVREPVAEEPTAEDSIATEIAQEKPAEETVTEELFQPDKEPEKEPVTIADNSTAIHDLPENVWSLRGSRSGDQGIIRFAEDIAELKDRGGPRRGRRGGSRGGGSRGGVRAGGKGRRTNTTKGR